MRNLIFAGNHGAEIEGFGVVKKLGLPIGFRKNVREFLPKINKITCRFKGLFVEDKQFTLSIHYRNVPLGHQKTVVASIYSILSPYLKRKVIRVFPGKKVLEIRPVTNWHKGRAVNWILRNFFSGRKSFPVYFGDDMTDEDAFGVLEKRGIGILVGKKRKSKAHYSISSPAKLIYFLEAFIH